MLKITVIGMGYVGLPLVHLFSLHYTTVGYDLATNRIAELQKGHDAKGILTTEELQAAQAGNLTFSHEVSDIADSEVYIITVPTPTDMHNCPDLSPLKAVSQTVGEVLKRGDLVVYESTVYPGVTQEECLPILEHHSGLRLQDGDFGLGYSPERVNPGDREHTVSNIKKVVSGDSTHTTRRISDLYGSVISAGVYVAPSIRVAEAAKIIENCQRDVNIAFFNELSRIFSLMEIDTHEVIQAAATKWNFIAMKPGLVGGHCIGVDPYYLIDKSQMLGYSPNILKQARTVNDSMGVYVAEEVVRLMNRKGIMVKRSRILILGFTFKENCSDIRNTKVMDVYRTLLSYTDDISLVDPYASVAQAAEEYGVTLLHDLPQGSFDVVILAVAHAPFLRLEWQSLLRTPHVLFDVQGVLSPTIIDARL